MSDIFTIRYGTPKEWTCPDCGILFIIYPAIPFEHLCSDQIRYAPETVYYFFRGEPSSGRTDFCITYDNDPNQYVEISLTSGDRVRVARTADGDLTVFRLPLDWNPHHGISWSYDKRLQVARKLPEEMHKKEALRGRVTG